MKTLSLQSKKGTLYSKIAAIFLCIWGAIYLLGGFVEIGSDFEMSASFILNCSLGLLFTGAGVYSYFVGPKTELTINKDFLRIEENTLIRTAYWNHVEKITLKRHSISVIYESGASERFSLPYLSARKFEAIKGFLNDIGKNRYIDYSKKPWWHLF